MGCQASHFTENILIDFARGPIVLNKLSQANQEAVSLQIYLLWFAVVSVFFTMVTIVAPGRGAALIQDEVFFLQTSWNVANGFGFDRMLPQAPHYFFHALLMKLGLKELLHFRYINYAVILVSSSTFFLGLDKRRFNSPVVPVAICASLFVSLYTIQSPNSLALAFFLVGAGCYFFAIDCTSRKRSILFALSGVFFAIAGFMHAAVAIAMLVLIAIVWIVDRSRRSAKFVISFLLLSLVLWGMYISSLGIDSLLAHPAGHESGIVYFYNRIRLILRFYQEAVLAYVLVLLASLRLGREKFSVAQSVLSVLVTLFYGAAIIAYVTGNEQPQAISGLHAIYFLTDAGQWISCLPGTAFYLLLFATFRWLGEGWFVSRSSQSPVKKRIFPENGKEIRGNFQFFVNRLLAPFHSDTQGHKCTVAVLGVILIQAATAVGSHTGIIQGMVFYAGPAFGLAIYLWESLDRNSRQPATRLSALPIIWMGIALILLIAYAIKINTNLIQSIVRYVLPAVGLTYLLKWGRRDRLNASILLSVVTLAWLTIAGIFALTYNHSANEPILSQGKVVLQDTPMRGILVPSRYATFAAQLRQKYQLQRCQSLPLVVLDVVPLVYYMLQHPTPGTIGVPYPAFYFPEEQIRAILDLETGWCVVDVTGRETQAGITRNHGIDKRSAIRAWARDNSDRIDEISSPSDDVVGPVYLYVRDKR